MITKPKICKGLGKAKDFGCGVLAEYRQWGLCNDCKREYLLSPKGAEVLQKSLLKARKQRISTEKKQIKAKKDKLKTYSQKVQDARAVFQKWIRNRDKDKPCISCDTIVGTFHAGHFLKAELYSGLIFNEDNCHKQCVKCNYYKNGNEIDYRLRLIDKIGIERVERLESSKNDTRLYKYSDAELEELKTKYRI